METLDSNTLFFVHVFLFFIILSPSLHLYPTGTRIANLPLWCLFAGLELQKSNLKMCP